MSFYLDTDTTPTISSRYIYKGLNQTIAAALRLMSGVDEGQIGIYENHIGSGFRGYAIKYPNEEPYFEVNDEKE